MSDEENNNNSGTPEAAEKAASASNVVDMSAALAEEAVDENGRKINGKKAGFDEKKIKKLADDIKEGDDALGKLKIQNLDFILDIPLKVTVELGRSGVMIKDLLQLGQGSVIELDKMAGEPLEILVNGKTIARGEVVVVNEKFGARITDIISPIERIEKLK